MKEEKFSVGETIYDNCSCNNFQENGNAGGGPALYLIVKGNYQKIK